MLRVRHRPPCHRFRQSQLGHLSRRPRNASFELTTTKSFSQCLAVDVSVERAFRALGVYLCPMWFRQAVAAASHVADAA